MILMIPLSKPLKYYLIPSPYLRIEKGVWLLLLLYNNSKCVIRVPATTNLFSNYQGLCKYKIWINLKCHHDEYGFEYGFVGMREFCSLFQIK